MSGWYHRAPYEGAGETLFITLCHTLLFSQLQRQAREKRSYGKGVADILVKVDSSLPAFVAIV